MRSGIASARLAVASVLALLLVLAAYTNSLDNAFHFDDSHVIVNNLYLRSLANVPRFFTDTTTFSSLELNAQYRPLLSTTFALDYWLAGELRPRQFHLTQIALLLALGAGLAVLYLDVFNAAARRRWNPVLALFCATLFCIHTANSETVNYISARSSLLATLAVVASFLVYLRAPRLRRFHLYLAPMMLGILVKPTAVVFAPLLLVYLVLFESELSLRSAFCRSGFARLRASIRSSLPAFLVGLVGVGLVESMNPPALALGMARLPYALTQPFVWLHYLRLFFLPIGLTADTDWKPIYDWYDTRVFVGVLGIGLLAWAIWKSSDERRSRPIAFGLTWFAVGLLPTSSVVPLFEVANEHRIFLPYVGLAMAVPWWLSLRLDELAAHLPGRRRALGSATAALAVLVLVVHATGTYQRNEVWRSAETLWGDVVEKSPGNGRGWLNYGIAKMRRGQYEEARSHFERAQVTRPNYWYLETNLAVLHAAMGENAAAERHFRRALELYPGFADGMFYYADWLVDQQRAPEALDLYVRTTQASPAHLPALQKLMRLYAALGASEALGALASDTLAKASDDPWARAYAHGEIPFVAAGDDASSYFHLAFDLSRRERHLEAAGVYQRVVALDPTLTAAWNDLGWSLAKLGFFDEASRAFEKSLELWPENEGARANLAWARQAETEVKRRTPE